MSAKRNYCAWPNCTEPLTKGRDFYCERHVLWPQNEDMHDPEANFPEPGFDALWGAAPVWAAAGGPVNRPRRYLERLPINLLDNPWALDETGPLWPYVVMMAAAALAVVVMVVSLRIIDARHKARADAGEILCYQEHGADCPGGRP